MELQANKKQRDVPKQRRQGAQIFTIWTSLPEETPASRVLSLLANRIKLQADEVAPQAWPSAEQGPRQRPNLVTRETAGQPSGRTNDPGRRGYFPLGIMNLEAPQTFAPN